MYLMLSAASGIQGVYYGVRLFLQQFFVAI